MMKMKPVSAFIIALFIGSSLAVGFGVHTVQALTTQNQSMIASADGSENNHLPKSMLVYTEFADSAADQELAHTLAVVNDHFLQDYQIVNLTDYNELASMIMDFDVFLVPEQEQVTDANIESIGNAWTGVLDGFLQNGGVVVILDCVGLSPGLSYNYGPTLQIFNQTGLIDYTEGTAYPSATLNVINANDALARGTPSSFPATDGTLRFNGTGGITVVDDGVGPVVVHKTIGNGHIAILGFDFYDTGDAQEAMLVNAIQLTRHVVFDESHNAYGLLSAAFLNYSLDLVSEGFAVSAMTTWDPATILRCNVLVLSIGGTAYSSAEVDVIEDFVTSGGGLIVYTDWGSFGNVLDPVTNRFGFIRNDTGYVQDTDDVLASYSAYNQSNFQTHSMMLKVYDVEFDRGGTLIEIPDNGIALITTDDDGTTTYNDGSPANGVVLAAAAGVGLGRVTVVTDHDFLYPWTDPDTDGIFTYFDADNDLFARNAVRWASGAGSEEKFVLFDESKAPNWYLNASYYGFGNFLTENGYTIRWMFHWEPTLLNQADVFVVQDGSRNYTASQLAQIVGYVSNGGGLCLLGGQTAYGEQADYVGNEFGLDLNNTGYILDSDDYLVDTSNILYDESNFGSHPIMNGVTRLELYWTAAFISIGSGTSLVKTDTDGTATWNDGTPANGLTLMTALEYNKGRVFFSADYIFPRYNADYDGDGIPILYDSDNDILLRNVFYWLSENRAPSVEVTAPNGGEVLSGIVLVNWTADDFDSDPLTFDVYYSDNNGSDWNLLESGLTGLQYSWNTTQHDDGDTYLIRVEVSDGTLIAMDDSDSAFELDNYGAPGFVLDPLLIAIIAGAVIVIVVILIILSKKSSGKE